MLGYQLSVYLEDGSILTVPYGGHAASRQALYRQADGALAPRGSGNLQGRRAGEKIAWSLPQAVDPQQVVGIAIGQRYIPIRADNTAGPGRWLDPQ